MNNINTFEHLNETINKENGVLVYFSHESCNVCKVLKPKVADLVKEKFPKLKMVYSDTVKIPEAAGQNRIFAVPTILVFLEGREYIRASRNISVDDLERQIERPYNMMFDN
ncbi:MAG TPA: thioredoxin [Bacteroidetes bacterium]|nr:thioredoxin [Bacteroidota bacterium]